VTNTFYRKTVHTDKSRGFGDLFIWFGGLLNKSVLQGPIICHPLFPTTTRLLLAPVAIEPVSNFFSLFMWALGNYCFFQMSSSIFSCTVFLYKVFGRVGGSTRDNTRLQMDERDDDRQGVRGDILYSSRIFATRKVINFRPYYSFASYSPPPPAIKAVLAQ
jgi:hypothetical protein